MASSERHKIIIDTDCGIDDSIALLLAFSSKDIADVIAITCCYGNTSLDNVCSNVKRVLTVCEEKNIPIHRGCSGPLITQDLNHPSVHGSDGLGNCAHEFSTGDLKESGIPAPVALVNLAKKFPKQITVIALGPLTNLAVAHRIDPEFTKNLKSLSIMGGNYKGIGNVTETAEWNFYCDPESANMILTETLCPTLLVPWETTMEFGIPWELYDELRETKTKKGEFFKVITRYLVKLCEEEYESYVDCDFLPTAAALYPDCIKSTVKHPAVVEQRGTHTRGLTILQSNKSVQKTNVEVVTDFHMDTLIKLRRKLLL